MKKEFNQGDIVISTKGHDQGRIYVVIKTDIEFAFLADGDYRSMQNLKKKRQKHIKFAYNKQLTDSVANEGIIAGLPEKTTDADIKRIIKEWRAYAERR